jgi:pimeloyl-ACP methyl ester carboxylesterase
MGITDPVVLCGLSMGGYVAFAYYRKYPERLRALILTATRALPDSVEAKASRDKAAALTQKEGVEAIVRAMLPKMLSPQAYTNRPALVQRVRRILTKASVPGIVAVLAGMRDRPDSTPILAQIVHPTLLIFGEDDQIVPRPETETLHASIRGSQLHFIPSAGHLPNLEQPELFNQIIRTFLGSL